MSKIRLLFILVVLISLCGFIYLFNSDSGTKPDKPNLITNDLSTLTSQSSGLQKIKGIINADKKEREDKHEEFKIEEVALKPLAAITGVVDHAKLVTCSG